MEAHAAAWLPAPPPGVKACTPGAAVHVSAVSGSSLAAHSATYSSAASSPCERSTSPFTDGRCSPSPYLSSASSASGVSEPAAAAASAGAGRLGPDAAGATSVAAAVGAAAAQQLTEPTLQALQRSLSRQGSAAAALGGQRSSSGSRGPSSGSGTPTAHLAALSIEESIEARLQGLSISGAATPHSVSTPGGISFTAPPATGLHGGVAPVEVFARFPPDPPACTSHGHSQSRSRSLSGGSLGAEASSGALPAADPHGAAAYGPGGYAHGGSQQWHHQQQHGRSSVGGGGVFVPPVPQGGGYAGLAFGQSAALPMFPTVAAPTGSYHAGAFFPQSLTGPPTPSPAAVGGANPYMLAACYPGGPPPPGLPLPPPFFPASHLDGLFMGPAGPYAAGAALGGATSAKAGAAGGYAAAAAAAAAAEWAHWAQYQAAMATYLQGYGAVPTPGSPQRYRGGGNRSPWEEAAGRDGWRPRAAAAAHAHARGAGLHHSHPHLAGSDGGYARSDASSDAVSRMDPELAALVVEDPSELASELLETYRAGRADGRGWELKDLLGHLYPFCKDQYGSRLVQQGLDGADPELLAEAFAEVQPKLLHLMVDVFGNYVVQKFLERGGPEIAAAIGSAMAGCVLLLSLHVYGCRVVQKALEALGPEERVALCDELSEHALRCVRDQNGNHAIVAKCGSLSTHTFGCRLVQRVLQHCTIAELTERTRTEVLGSAQQLAHDQFGNYVIQHLVAHGPDDASADLIVALAQHKYASNVAEACLKHGTPAQKGALIGKLLEEAATRPAALQALLRDQFGNYVAQRALDVATPEQRAALLAAIAPHLPTLRKYSYGKHIAHKAESLMAQQRQLEAEEQGPAPTTPTQTSAEKQLQE
eukprot:scaffold12.g8204.t1